MVLSKKIGDGGSASVFKADWNGKQVAVKKLKQVTPHHLSLVSLSLSLSLSFPSLFSCLFSPLSKTMFAKISGMDASGLRVDTVDSDAFSQTFHEFRREAYIMRYNNLRVKGRRGT